MYIINYFFEKHIERCKKELENFENNIFRDIREDLKAEAKQYINGANTFLDSINAYTYSDFSKFNGMIKALNDELNRIMKASANISTLVYVIQNVSEDDFYTYTDFISSFSYDENKFNNANERDIKNLKRLDKFLEIANDDFELYKERGDLKAELGFYNEAIDDYKKALELNPNYDEAEKSLEEINKKLLNIKPISISNKNSEKYYEEGLNYFKEKKYEDALKSFDNAIELDNTKSKYYSARGRVKNGLEKYGEAKRDAETSLELDKNNAEGYLVLGNIKRRLSLEEAIKEYDKAIKLNPNYSDAYNNRGLAKKNLGQYFEAIKDFDKAIKLDPNDNDAYNNRGLTKSNLGEHFEAIKDFDKAIKLDPNDSNAYYNRGVIKDNLEQYEEAIKDYDKAIELNPNDNDAYNNRGLDKSNLGEHFEAIKDFDKAIELDPNDPYPYNNRGVSKEDLGQYEEALKDYKKALKLDPNNNTAINNIKYIQDRYGLN